jgi:hypothetical protein
MGKLYRTVTLNPPILALQLMFTQHTSEDPAWKATYLTCVP